MKLSSHPLLEKLNNAEVKEVQTKSSRSQSRQEHVDLIIVCY